MSKQIVLRIFDILGSTIWVSTDDGQKVYDKIKATLDAGHSVSLSFDKKETMITAFLNAAVGQLYSGAYTEAFLDSHFQAVDIKNDDRVMLSRTIENAKRYFARKQDYDRAWMENVDVDEQ